MGLSRSERALTAVRWLAKETGKTHYQIGEAMGYKSRSGFSQAINGKKNLPGDFTERLVAVDGRINPDFLDGKSDNLLVDGYEQPYIQPTAGPEPFDMKLPRQRQNESRDQILVPKEFFSMISDMQETIRSQQETITMLVQAITGLQEKRNIG